MVSFRGQKKLGHAEIGLFKGFNSKFQTSIATPFTCGVPPPHPPGMALGCRKEFMDSIMIDNHEVRSTECLKLLGVCIDNNLCFDEHISSISKKSAQKVGVLMRLRKLSYSYTCIRQLFSRI